MSEPRISARTLFRLAVLLTVTASVTVGVRLHPGRAAPETVVRTVDVPARKLLPRAAGPGVSLVQGELRSVTEMRTPRARVCSPIWSTGVGAVWTQRIGGEVHALLAVEDPDGSVGPEANLDSEDGPDPGTPDSDHGLRGSSLLWTGGSRCVRLALALRPGTGVSDLRVVFVNSSGTARGPATGPPNQGPIATDGPPLDQASALAQRPRVVVREQWGADPDLMNCTPLVADQVRMGFVHHTAGSNDYSPAEADDVVRAIYAYHTNGRGWCDIGYNFLIDRFGTIFEGRSGGMDLPVVGAAQMGFNTGAFSASVMGNFETVAVPKPVQRALVRLFAWRLDVAHVNPLSRATMTSAGGDTTRYEQGEVVRLPAISGHRDTGFTACPGARLYAFLPQLRQRVASRGLPKIYKPRLSRDALEVDRPANVRVRARGSEPLAWRVIVLSPDGTPYAELGEASGRTLDITWYATGPPAQPSVAGGYVVVITAVGPDGTLARPATVPLSVLPEPTPSPTPPPSPSPSQSPSGTPSP